MLHGSVANSGKKKFPCGREYSTLLTRVLHYSTLSTLTFWTCHVNYKVHRKVVLSRYIVAVARPTGKDHVAGSKPEGNARYAGAPTEYARNPESVKSIFVCSRRVRSGFPVGNDNTRTGNTERGAGVGGRRVCPTFSVGPYRVADGTTFLFRQSRHRPGRAIA